MTYSPKEERALYELTQQYLEGHDQSAQDKVRDLQQLIRYHEWKYYVQNSPVISDFEYDQLYQHLEDVERAHPELISPDSPTQRVSSDLTSDFKTVKHLSPMLSLANSYNTEDLLDFDKSGYKEYQSIFWIKLGTWQELLPIERAELVIHSYRSKNTPNGISPTLVQDITIYKCVLIANGTKFLALDFAKEKDAVAALERIKRGLKI